MAPRHELVEAARAAYRRHRFDEAHRCFTEARQQVELGPDDLAALAESAWWVGRVEESTTEGEAAHLGYLGSGEHHRAARAAIDIAVRHLLRGENADGSAWLDRAADLLADDPGCAEAGHLRYLREVEAALDGPDPDRVVTNARAVGDLGRRLRDPSLVAAAAVGEGRVLIRDALTTEGLALLDHAMIAVLAGELAPDRAGNLYCHAIAACDELTDLRRAAHWTEALERWLHTIPAAVAFTGFCRVHRSRLLQLAGRWDRAERVAEQVCAELGDVVPATAAEGHYQVGEIRRLRGDTRTAEAAYRRAERLGRDPLPGVALLHLAQGRPEAAAAALRTALAARTDRLGRARLCAAQVEIALAQGDTGTARESAVELARTARSFAAPGLLARAAYAEGAVLLAEGSPAAALLALQDGCRRWLELGAPYECARTRVRLAGAYAELGDEDSAERELDAAFAVFTELGAAPDVAALAAQRAAPRLPDGLTEREADVLRCLAAGRTNKEIAAALGISDRAVQWQVSAIVAKLGLASRADAASYAFEHRLVQPAVHG